MVVTPHRWTRIRRWRNCSQGSSGEIIGAQWSEIDLRNKTWTIPAERMKGIGPGCGFGGCGEQMLGGAREFRYDWILLRAGDLPHEA
jgi:integrase